MNLSDLLNSTIGQNVINSVSSQLGMNQQEASSAVNAAVPVILAGLTKNAQSQEGAESLNNALETQHDGSLLDNLMETLQNNSQSIQDDGHGILGHIFGDNKPAIEQGLSQKTGVSSNKIGQLLAMLAPIVMAYIGKQKSKTNTDAGGLGDLLGGLLSNTGLQSKGGGLMGMISGILDKDGDGNPLNDILGNFFGAKK